MSKEQNIALGALEHLKDILMSYSPISEATWLDYKQCLTAKHLSKKEVLYYQGKVPTHFAFIHKGLMRAYLSDEEGNEFNKNFFDEGRFPGSMSALINAEQSFLTIEAIEDCDIIEINFSTFRKLLFENVELMKFHIRYLEKHWLIEKERKEASFLQFEAKQLYLTFLADYQAISARLTQYHIASYLGITPTQLSRIRKNIEN